MSLIRGGSLYWIQEKAGLIRPQTWDLHRRLPFVVAIAWLPLPILAALHGGWPDVRAVLADYRVWARVFIAVPLLLVGQIVMDIRFRDMALHFADANLVGRDALDRFVAIMRRARRLRDAKLPELIIAIAVYAEAGYLSMSKAWVLTSWSIDAGSGALTPAGSFSLLVTQPLFLVLLSVTAWKWAIWAHVLAQISRLPLRLDATNGDCAGGLGFLADLPAAVVPAIAASSVVIGANWRVQVLAGRASVDVLMWPAIAFAVINVAVCMLPLAVFVPQLVRERRYGMRVYGALQHLHSLQFREKWTSDPAAQVDALLGTPDVSSLADISSSFKNVDGMTVYPCRRRTLVALLVAATLPLLPVLTTTVPLAEIVKTLFAAMH
ncbi:MAG TPA: hypothetical protein VG736_07780 [Vicinamibacterales bacterium]|jgi:hypothetical protein|nr:hypothetical protein [Vicinamibacterales bacterium]